MREAAVEVRVVDVALPADRRARLLEVGAHHDQQVVLQLVGHRLQAVRVLDAPGRGRGSSTGRRPRPAGRRGRAARRRSRARLRFDQRQRVVAHRHALLQQRRRDQRAHRADAHVVDAGGVERAAQGFPGWPRPQRVAIVSSPLELTNTHCGGVAQPTPGDMP